MIAIGNNEKCPFCDIIITEDIDTLKHLLDNHKKESMEKLFELESLKDNNPDDGSWKGR